MGAHFDAYRRGIAHEGFHPALGGVEHARDVVFVRAREIHGGRWSRARACAVSSLFRERESGERSDARADTRLWTARRVVNGRSGDAWCEQIGARERGRRDAVTFRERRRLKRYSARRRLY